MKQYSDKRHYFLPVKMILIVAVMLSIIAVVNTAFVSHHVTVDDKKLQDKSNDSVASVDAFEDVYKVLMHPRCMNCHPKGDVPLQGDDSHLHTMTPMRGKDGHGVYAMKCANCHQPENTPGQHTPPGNPKWALPPLRHENGFRGKKCP